MSVSSFSNQPSCLNFTPMSGKFVVTVTNSEVFNLWTLNRNYTFVIWYIALIKLEIPSVLWNKDTL